MSRLGTLVRRITGVTGGDNPLGQDEFGNLTISQVLPKYTRLAAAGKLFSVNMTAGTAIAPVVAAPTTSPQWGLYNSSSSECLVLIQVACALQEGVTGLGLAIMGAAALGTQTDVTADYSGTVKTCMDGSGNTPSLYLDDNPTLVGGTPSWTILAQTQVNTVAGDAVGEGLTAWVDGALIARPNGGMVAVEIVGETGTAALFDVSFIVAMLELDYY